MDKEGKQVYFYRAIIRFGKQQEEYDRHHGKQHERFHRNHRRHHEEFRRFYKSLKYLRPAILIFNLIIIYLLFWWVGIKTIGIILAAFIGLKEVVQFLFLWRLEKRILKPVDQLKKGLEEVAKGNYDVRVECDVMNDISLLAASFNETVEKLRQGEKIKTEYEENRKALIANISHDLKTPITSIQGYIEAILDGSVVSKEDTGKYLQVIYRNTEYMNKLIDDLFLFSKLDMEKLDFQFERTQVKAFMNDLMEEFKFELEDKGFIFTYTDRISHDYIVNIDRKRLHQTFRNIIGNAVKYGPENGLVTEVDMYDRNGFVCIDIKDNGPGISPDKLPYIFDRFYRIDVERTKNFMSTGLGLAIAKELVEAHGGKIGASSAQGAGTCITIELPAAE